MRHEREGVRHKREQREGVRHKREGVRHKRDTSRRTRHGCIKVGPAERVSAQLVSRSGLLHTARAVIGALESFAAIAHTVSQAAHVLEPSPDAYIHISICVLQIWVSIVWYIHRVVANTSGASTRQPIPRQALCIHLLHNQ